MRYGVAILGQRVAPRCTIAEAILVVTSSAGRVVGRERIALDDPSWPGILGTLADQRVDTLVCGGIDRSSKSLVESHDVTVVENVASTAEAVVAAIAAGSLRPGLGFHDDSLPVPLRAGEVDPGAPGPVAPLDCLACEDLQCLRGRPCRPGLAGVIPEDSAALSTMLESAMDIALESERTLCRLSELIYFCLEMGYRRLGVAYCSDLAEPARILVGLLRRHFEVIPVWCKIGGKPVSGTEDGTGPPRRARPIDLVACNPRGQAAVLNRMNTDINVALGLCMGADCLFNQDSRVPVTTFVVKDKSLANNPIGALYSDHYLKEAARTSLQRT